MSESYVSVVDVLSFALIGMGVAGVIWGFASRQRKGGDRLSEVFPKDQVPAMHPIMGRTYVDILNEVEAERGALLDQLDVTLSKIPQSEATLPALRQMSEIMRLLSGHHKSLV